MHNLNDANWWWYWDRWSICKQNEEIFCVFTERKRIEGPCPYYIEWHTALFNYNYYNIFWGKWIRHGNGIYLTSYISSTGTKKKNDANDINFRRIYCFNFQRLIFSHFHPFFLHSPKCQYIANLKIAKCCSVRFRFHQKIR